MNQTLKEPIPKDKRKKILLLSDDMRFFSGIATISRNLVVETAHRYNWCQIGGSIQSPDMGKRLDISGDINKLTGLTDSYVMVYPVTGYGNPQIVRDIIKLEKVDAIMLFTDPRYWTWFWQCEHEIRQKIPVMYLNIWDDAPAALYNNAYYQSNDLIMNISKQTNNLVKIVFDWAEHEYEEIIL